MSCTPEGKDSTLYFSHGQSVGPVGFLPSTLCNSQDTGSVLIYWQNCFIKNTFYSCELGENSGPGVRKYVLEANAIFLSCYVLNFHSYVR